MEISNFIKDSISSGLSPKEKSGIYMCKSCMKEVTHVKDKMFPPCSQCGANDWQLLIPTNQQGFIETEFQYKAIELFGNYFDPKGPVTEETVKFISSKLFPDAISGIASSVVVQSGSKVLAKTAITAGVSTLAYTGLTSGTAIAAGVASASVATIAAPVVAITAIGWGIKKIFFDD